MNFAKKKKPAKVLLLGWPGKTSFLYFQVEKRLVSVIPTIGFNVETFSGIDGFEFEGWDIGGCDKIRPLVRHYYGGLEAVIIFIATENQSDFNFSLEVARDFITSLDLPPVPLALYCVQRDLPKERTLPDKLVLEELHPLISKIKDRPCVILFGSSVTPLGHDKLLLWLSRQVQDARSSCKSGHQQYLTGVITGIERVISNTLKPQLYVSVSDALTDDEFLKAAEDYSLPSWDHKTHLRLAYLVLTREGRRAAISRIMGIIKQFIDNSPHTARGKTFHVTMTYFWIQMVHCSLTKCQALASGSVPSFNDLLKAHPQLLDGRLFQEYYSDQLMLKDPVSREVFVLPDKKPLPNVI